MNISHKHIATPVLGIIAAVVLLPSSAAAFGGSFRANLSDEVRQELQACRQQETRKEKRECVRTVKEKHNLPMRQKRKHLQNIPEEARAELKACRDNSDTREEKHTCAQGVADKYNFELPKKHGRRGKHMRRRNFFQNLSEEDRTSLRAELQACREDNDTREERRTCAKTAIQSYRNS